MIDFDTYNYRYDTCPLCKKGVGYIISGDHLPPNDILWCRDCDLDHHIHKKLWVWKDKRYSEEEFEIVLQKLLKLKAFW